MAYILLSILFAVVSAVPVSRAPSCRVMLPTHATPRIVGGNEASPHTRSHIVSFFKEGCGGALLSDTWVLTAAHCLIQKGTKARVGGTNSSNGIEIPVKRVVNHPDYQFPKDDITLVELESPAPSSTSFMAVNSNPNLPSVGEFARVAGYGFQQEAFVENHDALLRQVDVPVMSTKKCIEKYFSVHSYLREDISAEKHICAGYDRGGCDSCTADSGGPLFVYDDKNSPIQIAIVSFGYGCAREVPGGYTRVSSYVSWMKSVGVVFEEKKTNKAVFGDTVSGASGPQPEEEQPASEVGGEHEEEDEPANENTSEPAPEHGTVPIPTPVTNTGTASPTSRPPESQPSDNPAEQQDSDENPIAPEPSPKPSPNLSPSPPPNSSPKPSTEPSSPSRLPPSQAGTPSPGKPPLSNDTQGGYGGDGRPRPNTSGFNSSSGHDNENGASDGGSSSSGGHNKETMVSDGGSSSSSGDETDTSASDGGSSSSGGHDEDNSASDGGSSSSGEDDNDGSSSYGGSTSSSSGHDEGSTYNGADGSEIGAEDNDEDAVDSEDNTTEEEGSLNESNGTTDTAAADDSKDDDDTENQPQNVVANGPGTNDSVTTSSPGDSEGDEDVEIASDDSDTDELSDGSDSSQDKDSAEDVASPVFVPGPSPEGVMPSFQTGGEVLEEAEPSPSPDVTESPKDANASNSETAGGDDGLSGLAIALIIVGAIVAIVAVGFLTYFIIQKVM